MERNHELLKRAQEGDKEAKESLVVENSRLVWSIVRKFSGRGYELEDLYQIGMIGLLKCIDKFDLNMDVKFSTYAVPMISGEIKRFLRDDGIIKVSRPLKEIAVKARYAASEIRQKTGAEATISQIAEAIGVDKEDVVMAMDATRDVESIHSTIYENNGSAIYMLDKLTSTENDTEKQIDIMAIKEILGMLKPKERQIIIMRYFADKTQTEIAKAIGISQVQVSRIEKKVINSIKEKIN